MNPKEAHMGTIGDTIETANERIAIDKSGNLYGVCRGSEFAFNPTYYSEHLLPQLNNTHGIGITLLAGVEMMRLNEYEG